MLRFEKVFSVFDTMQEVTTITNQLDIVTFSSVYCMILEEWCRVHGEDAVNQIEVYAQMIKEVNETCGKY